MKYPLTISVLPHPHIDNEAPFSPNGGGGGGGGGKIPGPGPQWGPGL